MTYGMPAHNPVVEVGVTRYSTVPVVALPGFVSTWVIADPDPATAPVIPPVTDPTVQSKVLGADAVSEIFVADPLHTEAVPGVVTVREGLTMTVIV
jgi:hypothetical protein